MLALRSTKKLLPPSEVFRMRDADGFDLLGRSGPKFGDLGRVRSYGFVDFPVVGGSELIVLSSVS